jgi:triosephosphate isomerase
MGIRKIIAGNWKMNGLGAHRREAHAIAEAASILASRTVLCPPATLVAALAADALGTSLEIGGQDCAVAASGAHTGDISAEMLADAGARWVIVGHSERRADHGETDALVRAKALAGARAGLHVILCVGEALAIREAGDAEAFVAAQLDASLPEELSSLAVAYEPVWAIGTGRVAGVADIAAMHGRLRSVLAGRGGAQVPILYGGSVKPENAAEILGAQDVDGVLVGGASLKAADFTRIMSAAG